MYHNHSDCLSMTRASKSTGICPTNSSNNLIPGHLRWSRTPAQYLQVRVGGYSSSWEAFQVASNTAVLFAGVYLTVGSLRDPFRESISTSSTISKLRSHFNYPMTSVPISAAGTSARRGGSEERLEVGSGLCGIKYYWIDLT